MSTCPRRARIAATWAWSFIAAGIGVAVEGDEGPGSAALRFRRERAVVVPAGRGGPGLGGRPFERNADGVGAAADGGHDPRRQAVTGGTPEDEDALRTPIEGAAGGDRGDLLVDVGGAANGVRRGADEPTNSGAVAITGGAPGGVGLPFYQRAGASVERPRSAGADVGLADLHPALDAGQRSIAELGVERPWASRVARCRCGAGPAGPGAP